MASTSNDSTPQTPLSVEESGTTDPTPTPTPFSPQSLQTFIYTANQLRANPTLAATIHSLANSGFRNSNIYRETDWGERSDRFETLEHMHETIGADGWFAVVWNTEIVPKGNEGLDVKNGEAGRVEASAGGKVAVACASLSRWKGDYGPQNLGREDGGWEIIAVVTKVGWSKLGLAGRCIQALTEEVVKFEQAQLMGQGRRLKLWVQAVEQVNGEYWRRRGWKFVRSYELPAGLWGGEV